MYKLRVSRENLYDVPRFAGMKSEIRSANSRMFLLEYDFRYVIVEAQQFPVVLQPYSAAVCNDISKYH